MHLIQPSFCQSFQPKRARYSGMAEKECTISFSYRACQGLFQAIVANDDTHYAQCPQFNTTSGVSPIKKGVQ
jgi:hypothetical protein